ncbi:PREDICTED: ephrin-A2-like isoform X2 [Poecilia mexicana]|uniref:ephrin-A2-like isoform X2 n=1 Tax=Poecilia mexicana TaxID=48701 RepID=UPI00072E55F8|nr:PREDICTED: ephrin-A2-like isoform X2 [Poecilia mexicana]XP_016533174.1 PREDICTED: ephrin-A2-like isoform X2 [Poecilia formosa]
MAVMLYQLGQRCVMELVLLTVLSWVSVWAEEKIIFDRHAVYWNSSNPKCCFQVSPRESILERGGCWENKFWHGEYRVAVNINDYLDIYCPFYEGPPSHGRMERYILFMVNHEGYTSCQHRMRGFKRWECNRPSGPDGPLRFSEKFQLFTPFSLGFEFRPGHEYYYISSPHPNHVGRACLKLKVYVRPPGSGYDSPEPFLTDGGPGSGAAGWWAVLLAALAPLILGPVFRL